MSILCPGAVRSQLWRTSRKLRGLPDIETPPASSLGGSASPTALDPAWVGRRVMWAVRDDELHVVTHPDRLVDVRARSAGIEAAFVATEAYLAHDPVA